MGITDGPWRTEEGSIQPKQKMVLRVGLGRETSKGAPRKGEEESHGERTKICHGRKRKSGRVGQRRSRRRWWAKAAAKASTYRQPRKEIYASIEYAAHFHAQIEDWKGKRSVVDLTREQKWENSQSGAMQRSGGKNEASVRKSQDRAEVIGGGCDLQSIAD